MAEGCRPRAAAIFALALVTTPELAKVLISSFVFDILRLQIDCSFQAQYWTLSNAASKESPPGAEPMLPSHSDQSYGLRVARKSELTAWLGGARPGDRAVYHQGFLLVDRGSNSSLQVNDRRRLDSLATALHTVAASGLVHLVQRRLTAGIFAYVAVKAVPGGGLRPTRHRRQAKEGGEADRTAPDETLAAKRRASRSGGTPTLRRSSRYVTHMTNASDLETAGREASTTYSSLPPESAGR